MSDNKYLIDTPLTSTKSKYIDKVNEYEKSLKDLICGSFGNTILERKTALDRSSLFHQLLAFPKKHLHTSTNINLISQKFSKDSDIDDIDGSLVPISVSDDIANHEMEITEEPCSSFSHQNAFRPQLFSKCFEFSSLPTSADSCFGFGSQPTFPRGALYSQQFKAAATSTNIPEVIIPKMPSYELSTPEIQESVYSIYTTYSMDSTELSEKQTISLKAKKLQFLNVVSMALMHSTNLKNSKDSYRIILQKMANEVMAYDPEFILKVALYARQELHMRTVCNFLLSYAAFNPNTRIYLKKYFKSSIVLPSDWIEVAECCQSLMNETSKKSFPSALRSVMRDTFAEFDEYQLAKYNRNNKVHKRFEDNSIMIGDDKENMKDCHLSGKKKITLKQMIKFLHINSPVNHVMSLLGKKYPENNNAFVSSGLSGSWDPTRAGKRMKLPIAETWETQISSYGNKSSVWESLIEKNKLPYMAILRNMKNLILSGISPKHHKKVIEYIGSKNAIINSRQLPMQFYAAYKSLSNLENMITKIRNGIDISFSKWARYKAIWARYKDTKVEEKFKNASPSVIEEYKNVITKALEISSLSNLHPIPGKILVICEVPPQEKDIQKKAIESVIMMGLMCKKASECCKLVILHCTDSADIIDFKHNESFLKIMMETCEQFKMIYSCLQSNNGNEDSTCNVRALQNLLDFYLKPQQLLYLKFDHLIFLHLSSGNASDKMKEVMSSFLLKYRQMVNSDLLYTDVNFSININNFIGASDSEKDVFLCGSSNPSIKFISERSSGGQLAYVENIHQKYNLSEISKPKEVKFGSVCNLPSEPIMPLYKLPKWHSVRIFVSSTFKDMISERDMLIRYVFPELRKRAASIFIKIAEIDLRWGITESDCSTQRVADLCLLEAQKSDLFVGFIGERYGTIYNFSPPDDPNLQWVKDCPSGLSITELEMQAAALRNSESSRKKAFFYFRDSSFIRYVPQKWTNHFICENNNSKVKVEELKSKIKSNGFRIFDGYPCHWAGIFQNKPILSGLDVLGENVLQDLWEAIQNVHKTDPFEDNVSEEEMYQQNLIDSLTFFVGKKNLNEVHTMIKSIESRYGIFVISGPSGSGKTAFSIKIFQNMLKFFNAVVVKFFIGSSPRSQELAYMIQYICQSICHQLSVMIPFPEFPDDVVNQFPDFLFEATKYSGGRDIILLIDGLDHLKYNDQRLDWLPLSLVNGIKIICSATNMSEAFKVLCERADDENCILFEDIAPLQQIDREHFIRNYLQVYRKTLDESSFNNHILKIVTKKDSMNPLYLRVVCDFLRMYASFDNMVAILQKLPSTLTSLYQEIIVQMENEYGSSLVQTFLSLLCISKLGLEDNDLHYILSFVISSSALAGSYSFDELKEKILLLEPENLLSQVKYCSLLHTIVIFAFGQLRQSSFTLIGSEFEYAVKKIYLNRNFANNCKYLHSVLASYYYRLCDINNNGKFNGQSGFAIRALLYHLNQGFLYKELCNLLCMHPFIESVFRTKADDQLMEYYYSLLHQEKNIKIKREINYNALIAFSDFVSCNFHIFHRYPQLVMQQALNEPCNSLVNLRSEEINCNAVENLSRSQILDCRLATVSGFDKNITASAGEMQKPLVILGSEDGYLKVFDILTRKVNRSIKGHISAITSICFAGKYRICASSVDGTLSLWNFPDLKQIAVLKGHRHNVTGCCTDPSDSFLFSSAWDNSVRLWSLSDGRPISIMDDFRCPVNCIDHHPMKTLIACGLWSGNIEIWDTEELKQINVFQNSYGSVKSIAYTPDGINILASFMESEVFILSSEEGLKMSCLKGHILPVKALTYSYDHSIFISGSDDCTLKVWSQTSVTGTNICTIDDCKFCPISLMEFLSQNLLAVAFQNSDIWVIDINNGKIRAIFNLLHDSVSCFSKYSLIGVENKDLINDLFEKSLIFGLKSGKLMVGELLSSSVVVKVEMKSKITALLHNYEIILCGCADGDIGIFLYSGHLLSKIIPGAHNGFITSFCMTTKQDNIVIWSTSNDNVVKIWIVDRSNFELTYAAEFSNKHRDTVTCSTLLRTSDFSLEVRNWIQYLLTGSHDNDIILWDNVPEKVFKGLKSSVLNVACSNHYVLGCGNDGSIVMWSHSGKILTSIPGVELSSAILSFHIAEDESNGFKVSLAFVDVDGSVKVTKPLERTFYCSLEGHSKSITSCCVAKNKEIVSCSLDGSINLWKIPTSVSVQHQLHSSAVTGIIISPSYEFVLSSDMHGNLILWKIEFCSDSPLVYIAKKDYTNGCIRGLSWLKGDKFACAVSQIVPSVEKYLLNTLSLECNSGHTSYSLRVNQSYSFESEILCLDTCPKTDVIILGLKSGEIVVINSEKQQTKKMCNDWLLGVRLFTEEKTSDFFCVSFVDGKVKLYSVTDFLESKTASIDPFAVYEPPNSFDGLRLSSTICCGINKLICCGDLQGFLRIYAQHSLKFCRKVHVKSITGICILEPYIFTSSLDKTIKCWNVSSFEQICQFHSHVPVTYLAALKTYLFTMESSDYILVLGTASGEVHLLKFHPKY